MENKKIIIITIVLFLLAGTGTFVFASNQGSFNEEDIDYRTDNDPTYEKVDGSNNNNSGGSSNNNNQGTVDEDIPPVSNPGIIEDPDETENNSGNGTTNPGNSSSSNNNTSNGSNNNNGNNSNNNSSNSGNNNNTSGGSNNNNGENNSGNNNQGSTGDTSKPEDKPTKPEEPEKPVIKDTTPPVLKIKYNTTNATKGPVIVTIESNEPIKALSDWSLANDKLSISKAFVNNEKGQVTIYDEAGNASTIEYSIQNIDNIAPTATVQTSNNNGNKLTFRDITVTITADKDIKPVAGWDLKDNRILTKTFSNIPNAEYSLKIYDLVGNEAEIKYEIRNYDPTSPEVLVEKGEKETTITMTYKEPLDDTWIQNENGEYTKVEVIPNNSDDSIIITMPDGTIKVYDSAPNLSIKIGNQKADGTFEKTNKPVEIIIESNKELQPLDGWEISEDKKTLTKLEYNAIANRKVTVLDLSGNTTTLLYTVANVDTTPPGIKMAIASKPTDGLITVTLITTEPTIFEDETWSARKVGGFAASYTKKFEQEVLEKGAEETFYFIDRYDNEATIKSILKYSNGKITIETID